MKTPQVAALPGMTPLGLPTKVWNATVAYKAGKTAGLWFGYVRAETKEYAKKLADAQVRGDRRTAKIVSVQVTLSGWYR